MAEIAFVTDARSQVVTLTGEPDRGPQMAERVVREALAYGIHEAGVELIQRAHGLAMETRAEFVPDDHHPMHLHPGRTVLVTMRDGGLREPVALAAAALLDTRMAGGEPTREHITERCGSEVSAFVDSVPRPGASTLLEDLVAASDAVVRVALSEQLDQLRHARLWAEPERAQEVLGESRQIYLPVAERMAGDFGRRFRWLCSRLERRSST